MLSQNTENILKTARNFWSKQYTENNEENLPYN